MTQEKEINKDQRVEIISAFVGRALRAKGIDEVIEESIDPILAYTKQLEKALLTKIVEMCEGEIAYQIKI